MAARFPDTKINVANAAKIIAEHCGNLDSEKAFACGLLHDIEKCIYL